MNTIAREELGSWLREQFEQTHGSIVDSALIARVDRITWRLNESRCGGDHLDIVVLSIPEIASFTAPGHCLYLSRGLIEKCADDAAVALAIAIQMAHFDLGHVTLPLATVNSLRRLDSAEKVAATYRGIAATMHTSDTALDADRYGLDLCLQAGYDGHACLSLFDALEAATVGTPVFELVAAPGGARSRISGYARHWSWENFAPFASPSQQRAELRARLRFDEMWASSMNADEAVAIAWRG